MIAIISNRTQRWVNRAGMVPQRAHVPTCRHERAIQFFFVISRQRQQYGCSASKGGPQLLNGRDYEHAQKALSSCSVACSVALLTSHNPRCLSARAWVFSRKCDPDIAKQLARNVQSAHITGSAMNIHQCGKSEKKIMTNPHQPWAVETQKLKFHIVLIFLSKTSRGLNCSGYLRSERFRFFYGLAKLPKSVLSVAQGLHTCDCVLSF